MFIMKFSFSMDWLLTIPGMLITGGVLLLLIALIIFIVSGRSKKSNDIAPTMNQSMNMVNNPVSSVNDVTMNLNSDLNNNMTFGNEGMASLFDESTKENQFVTPSIEEINTPPVVESVQPLEVSNTPSVDNTASIYGGVNLVVPEVEDNTSTKPIYGGVSPVVSDFGLNTEQENEPYQQQIVDPNASQLDSIVNNDIANVTGETHIAEDKKEDNTVGASFDFTPVEPNKVFTNEAIGETPDMKTEIEENSLNDTPVVEAEVSNQVEEVQQLNNTIESNEEHLPSTSPFDFTPVDVPVTNEVVSPSIADTVEDNQVGEESELKEEIPNEVSTEEVQDNASEQNTEVTESEVTPPVEVQMEEVQDSNREEVSEVENNPTVETVQQDTLITESPEISQDIKVEDEVKENDVVPEVSTSSNEIEKSEESIIPVVVENNEETIPTVENTEKQEGNNVESVIPTINVSNEPVVEAENTTEVEEEPSQEIDETVEKKEEPQEIEVLEF